MRLEDKRKFDFYTPYNLVHTEASSNVPLQFYRQERDWTCSLACIRTILSAFMLKPPEEEEFISNYRLTPGPYYSKDIKRLGLLKDYTKSVIYGCDYEDITFDALLNYFNKGYYVMMETMFNYAHWHVLLGFYPLKNKTVEEYKLLIYDPYYDNIRLLILDEYLSMWCDANHKTTGIEKDFIAIK